MSIWQKRTRGFAEIAIEDMWNLCSSEKDLFNGREGGRAFLMMECPLWHSEHMGYALHQWNVR